MDKRGAQPALDGPPEGTMGRTRREFRFTSMASVALHRVINFDGPGVDAAAEVDRVVETSISQKAHDPLAAGAVMAKNHERSIGRKIGRMRRNFRHRNMQGALQLAYVEFSAFAHIENDMLDCRAPQIREFTNRHFL